MQTSRIYRLKGPNRPSYVLYIGNKRVASNGEVIHFDLSRYATACLLRAFRKVRRSGGILTREVIS